MLVVFRNGTEVASVPLTYTGEPPGDGRSSARFVLPVLPAGQCTAHAIYEGDEDGILANTSALVSFTVAPASTSVTLTANPSSGVHPGPVSLRATVADTATGAEPNGTVRFTVTPVGGRAALVETVDVIGREATWSLECPAGAYTVIAEYLGNHNAGGISDFVPSTSTEKTFSLDKAATQTTLAASDVEWNAHVAVTGGVLTVPGGMAVDEGTVLVDIRTDDSSRVLVATEILPAGDPFSVSVSNLDVGSHTAVAR